jgi:hypothetical protein
MTKPKSPQIPKSFKYVAVPVALAVSTTSATPKEAPELIPNTNGPARGFLNRVCICKPLTPKAAPARVAVKALGKRNLRIST